MFHVEQLPHHQRFLEIFVGGAQSLGFTFSEKALEKFLLYYEEFCRWNEMVNLTSLKGEKEKIVLLFIDSLMGGLAFEGGVNLDVVDIGTGGGFPGIPLKIAFPEITLSLVEARSKKTAFLINVIGKVDISDATVIQGRLEELEKKILPEKKWDFAMIKGVNITHVIPSLKQILRKNGKLVAFRSKKINGPGIIPGLEVYKEIQYELPYGFGPRVISILGLAKTK
jgi:16S rRNA (guanine527-N7)-methyltransferase